jgi:hypothetical protein
LHVQPTRFVRALGHLGLVGALAMTMALVPTSAGAVEEFTNYREVPNNACDLDTPEADFTDREHAAEVHWRSIDCVADHAVAEGSDGQYHPGERVTRDQMASFVARTLEAAGDRDLPDAPDDHFQDTDGNVHEHRINQLAEVGIVAGRSADHFAPRERVSRAQMASLVLRAASWNHTGQFDSYQPAGDDDYFTDISGVHVDNIRTGHELWLYEGRAPGEFAPHSDVRRDAMATFLTRTLDFVHPGSYQNDNQTYQLSPMEPVTAASGEPIEFSVDASRAEYTDEAEPLPGPVRQALHIALFPCGNIDTELPVTFTDEDFDWVADDIARTDQGQAYISEVNGEPVEGAAGLVRNVPPEDGRIDVTLVSPTDQPDCTVAVAFDDRGPVDELRLDAAHRPANAFGFVQASWE